MIFNFDSKLRGFHQNFIDLSQYLNMPYLKVFPILVLFISSCTKDKLSAPCDDTSVKQYLHIAHTRTNENPLMDSLVETIDFDIYDMLWLGGDLAHLTSADYLTMLHVDSIFNLSSTNTLWALGNHDYTDLTRIESITKRPPFYATHKDGLTIVVLDTQDSLSNIIGTQKEFLDEVLDTIQHSSHLIILHHKLIWMFDNPDLEPQIDQVANGIFGDCFYCVNPNNFNAEIYPRLIALKDRGIEILCIGGDIGFKVKEFEYLSPEGIHFLASGIHAGSPENKALLFTHDSCERNLTWEYKLVSDL